MYNAEKNIAKCLDSLLIQTFQNFEVIVVDDCSTDNSVEVVKSYMPKFNGRLRLTKTKKNSGTDCVPRNIGMMLTRGEYIQFIDSDDMILGTALETLYKAAILYDADVVYTSSCYYWDKPDNIFLYKDGTSKKMHWLKTELTVDDLTKNLSRLLLEPKEGNFHAAWTKFVRRDFMLRNQIFFANLPLAGDFIGIIEMYCHARRFLRISTPLYFYRTFNDQAMSRIARPPKEQVKHWFSSFVRFCKALYELEKKYEVFAENPLYSLEVLKKIFAWTLNQTRNARQELDSEEIYKVLHDEFSKASSGSLAMLVPFLFYFIEDKSELKGDYTEIINRFRWYITGEIFVMINKQHETEAIQILSVSDDNAWLNKPEYWQRNGNTCHIIDSCVGKLEVVAKAVVEGNVQIRLAGPWVKNPNGPGLAPYWIDYTKLVVNGKTIFDDTLVSAWHEKHYIYEMYAKAGEEIKIQVEWLPHRSDAIESKAALSPQKKNVPKPIPYKFRPFVTARIDMKLATTNGDFQVVSISDDEATVWKPAWLQKGGVGYQIQSYAGKLELVAKPTTDGKVNCQLKGIDVKSPNKSKRIPHWIDYTNFTINGKTILDKITPAWHDEPYRYNLDVKADEEIKVQVEWLPHKDDT